MNFYPQFSGGVRVAAHADVVHFTLCDGSVRTVHAVELTEAISGLSPAGANQLLKGYIISDPRDRRFLANTLFKGLGFAEIGQGNTTALLLPAVQAAREAAGRTHPPSHLLEQAAINGNDGLPTSSRLFTFSLDMQVSTSGKHGLSTAGALQFLSADPVSDPNDRSIFAVWFAAALLAGSTASSTMHGVAKLENFTLKQTVVK